jgi:hypothetical protein
MNMNGKILGKMLAVLAPLSAVMSMMIYRTEHETYHHDMSPLTAGMIALALALIVAPFAYRYARDSTR